MECQCSVYSISLIMRRLALTTKLLYDIRETIKRKWVSYAVMQRGRAGKNSGLKCDMIPNLVRLCCTLLYCQSYQQLGAGQMKTLFYTQYWVSEDKYFHCVKCHKQHKLGICDSDDLFNPIHWYTRYVTFYEMYLSGRKFSLGKKTLLLFKDTRDLVYEDWYNLEDIDFL